MRLSTRIDERRAERDHVVAHGDADGAGDRRVHAHGLAHDHVEVRQRVERVHVRRVRVEREQLFAQLLLHVRRLREREEAPGRRDARGLVSRDDDSACGEGEYCLRIRS